MSDIGKVRLRIPSSIRPGDIVQVRSLVIHPMERIERDAQGKIIQKNYNYINKVIVTYLGKTVATFDTTQSVAENPFFSFTFKATDPGQLKVQFLDTTGGVGVLVGGARRAERRLRRAGLRRARLHRPPQVDLARHPRGARRLPGAARRQARCRSVPGLDDA